MNHSLKEVGDLLEHHKSMDEAMDRIGKPRPKHSDPVDAIKIFDKALQAGEDALNACTPTPMVVERHKNIFDDRSPVVGSCHVPDGVYGFAWIHIKLKNSITKQFINALKKEGLASDHGYCAPFKTGYCYEGYIYWVHQGKQSLQKKEAFAHAFAGVLLNEGIEAWSGSRMD